jgi:hypothetical protein
MPTRTPNLLDVAPKFRTVAMFTVVTLQYHWRGCSSINFRVVLGSNLCSYTGYPDNVIFLSPTMQMSRYYLH